MAFVSITPSANSIVATGDALVVRWSSTSAFPVISFRPANGAQETVSSPSDGGMNAGPGYTVAYDIDGSESLTTFSRDAGWTGSPFVISIWDSVLGTETLISYTLLGEGQYPPDMQPFNDPAEGGTAGVISIQDNGIDEGDATTLNFANNLDVTVSGGTATIVGAAGGAGGGDVSSSETAGTVLDAEVVVFDSTTGKLIKGAGPSVTVDTVNARVSAQGFVATADNITLNDGNVRIQGTRKGINILEADLPSLGGAGYGNYWVRDDTPQAPVFTDDTGTSFDLKGGTVSDGNTSTTLITDGVVFGSTPGAPATYSVAPEQKDSSFLGDDVAIAGGENIGAASGGSVYIRGGASSGSGVNGGVYLAPSNTTELFLGGTGTDLRINDGTGTGTAGYGLISDGTSASWQPNPGGGATDTVAGSNGITNTGDNTDAILTPTYGSAGDTFCQGNDSRLSNSRDPNVHATSHENGSGDEIDVAGLSGLLADPQTVGIEDSGTPDTYDATVLNFGTNMTVTVDAADGTATVNASASGSAGVHGFGSWNYDSTTTEADPGSGNFRLDDADPTAAAFLYIDHTNGDSQSQLNTLNKVEGWRLVFNNSDGTEWFNASCGVVQAPSGYYKIPISAVGSTSLTNTTNFSVTLAASQGFPLLDEGETVSDNAIIRGDAGARAIQDSSVTITDGGAVVLSSATSMVQVPERATGPTFSAGTGQFWVKNTSPSSPFFTQDDGTELDLTPSAAGTDADAIHVDVAAEISGITEKVTPIAADLLVIEDSADSNNKKRVQVGNLPFVANEAQALVVSARSSAGTINPGHVVYLTGWDLTNGVIEVDLADASAAATMPGFGIAQETITSAVTGQVVVSGEITNQVTTGYTEGDFLYVSETAGALTDTKPTGTAIAQHICVVNRAHATEGVLQIVGAGKLTLPSIAENNVWMGNASGVPTETARAGIDTDSVTHIALTDNPHETSLENLEPGVHNFLEAASVDSGKIFASLQTSQVASLTAEASPAATDLLLMERASDGAYRAVETQDLFSTLEQMPTMTIKGNNTGGLGPPLDLTVAQASAMIDHDQTDNRVENQHRVIGQGVAASRPAFGNTGDYYHSTDTGAYEYDNGSAWVSTGLPVDDSTIGIVSNEIALKTTGTPDGTKFLRDDMQWTVGGGGVGVPGTTAVGEVAVYSDTDGDPLGRSEILIGSSTPTAGTRTLGTTPDGLLAGGSISGGGEIRADAEGAVALGYINEVSGTALIDAGGSGAFAGGVVVTITGTATINAEGDGAYAWGGAAQLAAGTATLSATGNGAVVLGEAAAGGTVQATGDGCFAQGSADNGTITAGSAAGAMAQGVATSSATLSATGVGSFAHGRAVTNNVTASGAGSFALGDSTAGAISASTTNAVQFGVGANAIAHSLKVGTDTNGIRLRGDNSTTTARIGDLRCDGTHLYVYAGASPTWQQLTT